MYTPLYDEKHRFQVYSAEENRFLKHEQKGIRERLLCSDCETKLSKYERYASLVFSGTQPLRIKQTGNLVEVAGLDYKNFRIFGLSIIWRAGVAKHEFFQKVRLGPHESKLRDMVLNENPGKPAQYGIFISPLVSGEKEITGLMAGPTRSRLGNHYCYRFVFGGLVWVFLVSSHPPPREFKDAFINEDGEMLMLTSELRETAFIQRSLKEIYGF